MKKIFFVTTFVFSLLQLTAGTTVKLYRYINPSTSDHIYTTDIHELEGGKYGYNSEGVIGYVMTQKTDGAIACHRYFNVTKRLHFYTTSLEEMGDGKYGFKYEGVAFYAYPTQVSNTIAFHRYLNKNTSNHFYTTNLDEIGNGKYGFTYEGVACYIFSGEQSETGTPAVATNDQPAPAAVPGFLALASPQSKTDMTAPGSFFVKGVETKGQIRLYKQDYENEGIPAEAMADAFVAADGQAYTLDFKLIDSIAIGDLFFAKTRYTDRSLSSMSEEQMALARILYSGTKASVYYSYVYDRSSKTYTHSLLADKGDGKKPVDVQAGFWNFSFKKQLSKLFSDCAAVSAKASEGGYGTGKVGIMAAAKDYNETCP